MKASLAILSLAALLGIIKSFKLIKYNKINVPHGIYYGPNNCYVINGYHLGAYSGHFVITLLGLSSVYIWLYFKNKKRGVLFWQWILPIPLFLIIFFLMAGIFKPGILY